MQKHLAERMTFKVGAAQKQQGGGARSKQQQGGGARSKHQQGGVARSKHQQGGGARSKHQQPPDGCDSRVAAVHACR